jgi:hypothetical protein
MDSPLKDWGTLDPAAIDSGLADLNLSLDRDNRAVICTRCKYALQPSSQTVSKNLWERHAVDAKRRRGLHALINSVKLPDPNTLCTPPDGTRPHPYLTVHEGFACRRCDFRTISTELAQRLVAKMHGKKDRGTPSSVQNGEASSVQLQSWTQNGERRLWIQCRPKVMSLSGDFPEPCGSSPNCRTAYY